MKPAPAEAAAPPGRPAADQPPTVLPTVLPKILIVDDSAVARAVIGRMIEASRRFALAGTVPDVQAALAFLKTQRVDAILLDIEMPGIDGLTALPDLIVAGEGAKVLVVSSSCDDGGAATIQALSLGAADTLVKPGVGAFAGRFSDVLVDKLSRLLAIDPVAVPAVQIAPAGIAPRVAQNRFDIVAIGASTGGIHALSQLLREIPADFTTPILITQHLPESFMPYFAAQVAVLAGRPCDVAIDRLRIRPGRVIIAPGDGHMRVVSLGDGNFAVRLTRDPARSGCMPSVDPMFESLAETHGARAIGIVLSGMGRDGSDGARKLVEAGGALVAQDRASSVVWGMPGAVAPLAGVMLPPGEIGRLIADGRRPTC
ncbi:chemotaxis protein CheB [Sphingomonas sp. GB1N7]|uniref:chemotaxis protein CheB n=1 Tax=Parasphingomonas caseinilytica TaxID=3096158 RepID=UPI002FCAB57A